MTTQDHAATSLGRGFLWGGATLGLLLLLALYTHGFGLFATRAGGADESAGALHRADGTILVPAGSVLRQRLRVIAAPLQQVSPMVQLPGTVEALPTRTTQILTPLAGRVATVDAALGDHVQAGQQLATLYSGDAAQAYADDDKARAGLLLAQHNLQRQEQQLRLGTASQRDLDQARSDHDQAQAEAERAAARLRALNVPARPARGTRLLAIRAPFAGTITSLSAAPGAMVNDPTQPLMGIADLGEVWVTAFAAEKDLAAIARGQQAEVLVDAWPGRVLHGEVQVVTDTVEPDTHRTRVRIAVSNADLALKPNMFATVRLHGAARTRVVLPTSALLMNNDRTSVFVATAPWTFVRRPVEPLLGEGDTVAIAAGLQGGEQVVVQGGILLND